MRSSSSAFSSQRRKRSARSMRSPVSIFSGRRRLKIRCSIPVGPNDGEEGCSLPGGGGAGRFGVALLCVYRL